MSQIIQTKQPLIPSPRKSRIAIRYLNYSPKKPGYFDNYGKTAILMATLSKKKHYWHSKG